MDRYLLDRHPEMVAVLHRHPVPACHLELAFDPIEIDVDTAFALSAMPDTRPCEHCIGMPDPDD
jgi:hypothetical protein